MTIYGGFRMFVLCAAPRRNYLMIMFSYIQFRNRHQYCYSTCDTFQYL